MNILLVAYYFPPINCAGSVRPVQMARWLRHFGHSVCILTHGNEPVASFSPEIIRIPDPAFARDHRGVNFWRWAYWRGRAEILNYCGHYASIFTPWKQATLGQAEAIGKAGRPDLVLATYPPLETLEIALELARFFRVPLVSDFRDGLMFRPIEEKRLRSHRSVRAHYADIEAAAASASSLITAVTPALQDYFHGIYPKSRCETIFNGYDDEEWLNLPEILLPPGQVHIVHTGRIALSDSAADISPFISAWHRVAGRNAGKKARLHLVGEYSRLERSMLAGLIRSRAAVIRPLVDRPIALAMQQAADFLLLVTRPGVRSGIPLKLFEYIRSGKPVLALSDDKEVRRIITESGCGWCVSPCDVAGITSMLGRLLGEPRFRFSLELRLESIGKFSWENQVKELARLLKALSPRSRRS